MNIVIFASTLLLFMQPVDLRLSSGCWNVIV